MTDKKSAGRNALAAAEKAGPEFIGKTPIEDAQAMEALHTRQTQLVEQFGDGLPWHPDHYEAAIRSELKRGCDAFLRAGRYLLVARECALHGEWSGLLERLGMESRQAQRMMEAARRIALLPNATRATHLIEATGSQSKLIELLSLPDDQFVELAETGATGGLDLDEVEEMTRDELRKAVREARADLEAKDQRISKLSDDLNKEHEKTIKAQRKWKSASPDEQQLQLQHAVTDAEATIVAELGASKSGLRGAVIALADHCDQNNLDCDAFLGDVFARLLDGVRKVRDDGQIAARIPILRDLGMEG
ncbi:MAG: hypothetical protein ACREPD_04730 [Stenotrophomonas sp.]|uniref:hypothetical protein n=1 Tax=Stenotrophomonas sp. TaxID=69392 RepID=UPI003D6CC226